jgi:hypothetical protein
VIVLGVVVFVGSLAVLAVVTRPRRSSGVRVEVFSPREMRTVAQLEADQRALWERVTAEAAADLHRREP